VWESDVEDEARKDNRRQEGKSQATLDGLPPRDAPATLFFAIHSPWSFFSLNELTGMDSLELARLAWLLNAMARIGHLSHLFLH